MVEVEATCERHEDVTLVQATVTNTRSTPQTIRLRSRLEGPVWPPRAGSVAAPEWDDSGWTGTVKPGRTRGLGFASPVPPIESPVEIAEVRRADGDESPSSKTVLADLEEWAPTTDVLSREL
ncbi:hypothetical protein Htur_0283 [Haloterrigena turkmenica DSM 5511]|uniref:Uncharacterized protein n=1 Tax=Haloterrigena turkmenica (strain ATCC 51198 / DSM 5511 / JCM 9101 / NCIMB 13204 / VKM B-1734 / 4k) TaxID=543526 RepID=D2RUB5_HALTV|nr:hypothetical protein [Haloterrigena turkmenica]ADB59184.1 hypothetical protein Htur_0283 [Haloterrigena turkmenica DSM 5511]